ncbi:MAG TPA: hypothetical protein PK839_01330 [Tenuifilaceae bacterium]|nr:hypothetical protein [Tenuifilaceae bacterium]
MKTKNYIPMLALLGFTTLSCSSSLQVSNTSSWEDEIYRANTKTSKTELAQDSKDSTPVQTNLNDYAQLDKKYADELAVNQETTQNDTISSDKENVNPYESILSDSYQESYERRLKGMEDPMYGLNDWSVYYSDSYRYAQAYDPNYYRLVVMGSQVWVEPWYIYNSFSWPRTSFYFGFGYGWGYNPWSWYYDPFFYSPFNYYNPYYYSAWNFPGNYWINHGIEYSYLNSGNFYYGRRPGESSFNTSSRRTASGVTPTSSQAVTRQRGDVQSSSINPIQSTKNTQTHVTPTYKNNRGSVEGTQRSGEQITAPRRETGTTLSNPSSTRGSAVSSGTRSEKPTRSIGISEPTGRAYNPGYDKPRTSSSGTQSIQRPSTGRGTTTSPSGRSSSSPTYNSPGRVSAPSNGSATRSGNSVQSKPEGSRSSGNSSGTYTPRTESSSSGSRGNSNSGSSGAKTRGR